MPGSWSNNPTTVSDQWEDCDSAGGACSPIASATGPTYTLTAGDVGHTIRLEVTADSNGDNKFPGPVSVESAPTAAVTFPPPPPTPMTLIRAVTMLLPRAVDAGVGELHSFPGVTNRPSNAVLERLGFQRLEDCDLDYEGRPIRCAHWLRDLSDLA